MPESDVKENNPPKEEEKKPLEADPELVRLLLEHLAKIRP
jgi:hypothetical protein